MSHAAQSYIKTDWSEKAKEYLDSAAAVHADILPEERNSELYIEGFYTYSNAQVLYYVYDSVDYHKALTYVSEALELADSRGDIRQSVIFGLNHVILNTMLQESFAYEGAEDLYAKAVELKDSKLLFNTAQICAWRFNYLGDYARAKSYIEISIANMPEGYMDASTVYADYAKTFHRMGLNDRVGYYYEQALKHSSKKTSSSTLLVYLSYAQFLSDVHEEARAEQLYKQGLALADSVQTDWNRKEFYAGLYKLYQRQKRASYFTLFKLYSEVLAERKQTQHKELKSEPTARTVQNLGNANGLFENIDKKMKEERIYRDAGLTLEKAAELIGTNRTYLSASIKQQTGLSFSYYVNSYRIQEAIELLSGPENDIPLKAVLADVGFKSPTTFYKLFQATTGQTPQKWRENIRQECLERHSSD